MEECRTTHSLSNTSHFFSCMTHLSCSRNCWCAVMLSVFVVKRWFFNLDGSMRTLGVQYSISLSCLICSDSSSSSFFATSGMTSSGHFCQNTRSYNEGQLGTQSNGRNRMIYELVFLTWPEQARGCKRKIGFEIIRKVVGWCPAHLAQTCAGICRSRP